VCSTWRTPDSGIWEVRAEPRHYTQSKAMCWVALDRAVRLAERGRIRAAEARWWASEAVAIRHFIEETLLVRRRAELYAWYADSDELDASLLLLPSRATTVPTRRASA
jgi:GH15 family glucan-1,4-alpha-glucosidase